MTIHVCYQIGGQRFVKLIGEKPCSCELVENRCKDLSNWTHMALNRAGHEN
jgi:hypothetical protein